MPKELFRSGPATACAASEGHPCALPPASTGGNVAQSARAGWAAGAPGRGSGRCAPSPALPGSLSSHTTGDPRGLGVGGHCLVLAHPHPHPPHPRPRPGPRGLKGSAPTKGSSAAAQGQARGEFTDQEGQGEAELERS